MLTDFLYRMKREGTEELIFEEAAAIRTTQGLWKGMTLKEVREIAAEVQGQYTPGLRDAINEFRGDIHQIAFSDGLAPFILYHTKWLGMEHVGVPTAIVETDTETGALHNMSLTGEAEPYDKAAEFMEYAGKIGVPLDRVAVIDDSSANVESMLLPVMQAGGLAVSFRPTDTHRKTFEKHKVPILHGNNLLRFMELVRNPNMVGHYCETF